MRPGRTSLWWENFENNIVVAEDWRENFRMSKENFMKLCDKVRPFLLKQSTNMRSPISVEKEVAIYRTLFSLTPSLFPRSFSLFCTISQLSVVKPFLHLSM